MHLMYTFVILFFNFQHLNGNIVGHYIMKKSVAVAIYNHFCDTTIGGIK